MAPAGGTAPPPDASSSAAAIHADTSAVTAPSLRGENLVDKILTCSFPVEVVTLATSSLVMSPGDLIRPRSRSRRFPCGLFWARRRARPAASRVDASDL